MAGEPDPPTIHSFDSCLMILVIDKDEHYRHAGVDEQLTAGHR